MGRTSKVFLASAVIVAGRVAVFAPDDVAIDVYLFAYGVLLIALVSLGIFGGGRALPVFAGTYLLGSILWQWLWWTDDPERSGIDDISPLGGFIITVPTALALIALGWVPAALARWARRRRRQRPAPPLLPE